ncbi:peptidoglycan-binding protein [Pseudovibrio exalbescens]|uniref:peptidoglycan-binding protein n=1 Tax=Pseudovibrio exalbescens TaxID=197461 RepID=UPI0015E0E3EC|nr:peptidoglycan-binding protein [Pseudovibrio exalbescens]
MSWTKHGHNIPDWDADGADTRDTGKSAQEIYASLLADKLRKKSFKSNQGDLTGNGNLAQDGSAESFFHDPYPRISDAENVGGDPLNRLEAQLDDVADALNELLPSRDTNRSADISNSDAGLDAHEGAAPSLRKNRAEDPSRAERVSTVLEALDRLDARLDAMNQSIATGSNERQKTPDVSGSRILKDKKPTATGATRHPQPSPSRSPRGMAGVQNLIQDHYAQLLQQIEELQQSEANPDPSLMRLDGDMAALRKDIADHTAVNREQLSDIVSRLTRTEKHGEALEELRGEIASMKQALSSGETEQSLKTLEDSYKAIRQRLEDLSHQKVDPTILQTLVGRLHELEAYLQQLPRVDQLAAMDERLTAMGERLEKVMRQSGTEGLEAVRTDIRNLRSVVDTLDSGRAIMEVDQRIRFLVARMDELEHFSQIQRDIQTRLSHVETRLPEAGTYDQLHTRLETITSLLADDQSRTDNSQQLDRVEARLQSITTKLEGIEAERDAPNAFEQAVDRIEMRIDDLANQVNGLETKVANIPMGEAGTGADTELLGRLEQQVAELTYLVEKSSSTGAADQSVSALKEEVNALRSQLSTLATPQDIEAQVQALAESLAQPSAFLDDAKLTHIEDQIATLATKLDETSQRMVGPEHIEAAIAKMDAQISGSKDEMMRTVQMAAREAAEAATRHVGIGQQATDVAPIEEAIADLRKDLQALLDREQRDDGNSLHDVKNTLATISERIAALDARSAQLGNTPISREHQKLVGDDHARGVLSAFTKRHRHQNAQQDEDTTSASQAARDKTADFIAAARRAAQAAAAEVRAEEGEPETRKPIMPDRARRLRDYLQSHSEQPSVEVPEQYRSATAETVPEAAVEPDDGAVELTEDLVVAEEGAREKRKGLFKLYSRKSKTPEPSDANEGKEGTSSSRRRAVVLAAAAVVLTIGTLQVFNSGVLQPSEPELASEEPEAALDSQTQPVQQAAIQEKVQDRMPQPTANAEKQTEIANVQAPVDPSSDVVFGDIGNVGSISAPKPDGEQLNNTPMSRPTSAMAEDLSVDSVPQPRWSIPQAARDAIDGGSTTSVPLPPETVGPIELRQAAASGDAAAQFEVAVRFTEGEMVTADLQQAAEWYRRAAAQGLAPAQYRLGSLYEKGRGLQRDLEKARDWYSLAAAQGNVKAMHNLAVLYAEGITGEPDFEEAARWFQMAADYGVADSIFNLGILTARGLGTPKDLIKSYKWFAIAAQQGDQGAAQKRDEIANMLDDEQLTVAREAVDSYARKKVDPLANKVPSKPSWKASPATPISFEMPGKIRLVQERLMDLGFEPGGADGQMGPKTRQAIRAYQKQQGMIPTGVVDGPLLSALTGQSI